MNATSPNYWGKSPWNAFVAIACEKMQERDVYHAGYARAALERAEEDGCLLGYQWRTYNGSCSLERIEFGGRKGGHWFRLDVCINEKTIYIRSLTGHRFREKIRRVEQHARRWLFGLYPIEDGEVQPRDTATMDLLIDRSLEWDQNPEGREMVRAMLKLEGMIDHKKRD